MNSLFSSPLYIIYAAAALALVQRCWNRDLDNRSIRSEFAMNQRLRMESGFLPPALGVAIIYGSPKLVIENFSTR